MSRNAKIIVLIPAYNTEEDVIRVFQRLENLNQYYDEIMFCDDGSVDKTLKIVLSIRQSWKLKEKIFIYRHKINRGYGAAHKTLFKHFFERKGDIAVMIHSDDQYPAERINNLIEPIINGRADLVLASRFYNHKRYYKEMPVYKILGNKFLTLIENKVLRSNLSEFHTGLRAYSKIFLQNIGFQNYSEDFVFDSEILFDAIIRNFKIEETYVFAKYENTYSHVNSLKYGMQIIRVIFKYLIKQAFRKD